VAYGNDVVRSMLFGTREIMRHMDYVHFNPVKHGYVSVVTHWPHSTFPVGEGRCLSTRLGWRGCVGCCFVDDNVVACHSAEPLRGFRPRRARAGDQVIRTNGLIRIP
jgi:hypothetical protein